MIQEVTRRHYLDAMGITAWGSRYQLPNALPTKACEWQEATPAATPPRERLQALLDDTPSARAQKPVVQKPVVQKSSTQKPGQAAASPSAVRALLVNEHEKPLETATPSAEAAPAIPANPLIFDLSCLCLHGRWLMLQAGEMRALEQRLLVNLLQAAGVQQGALPALTHFTWPMTHAFTVENPLNEAREGLAAFIAGQVSRQGWQLERILWWGELGDEQAPLDRVLNVTEGQSHTLSLPVWQGPALAALLDGTKSKRDLWPALQALRQEWESVQSIKTEDNG